MSSNREIAGIGEEPNRLPHSTAWAPNTRAQYPGTLEEPLTSVSRRYEYRINTDPRAGNHANAGKYMR